MERVLWGMFSQQAAVFFRCWPLPILLALTICANAETPRILITAVPAYGSVDDLIGVAVGAKFTSNAVATFIYVPGYGWVSKPTCAEPLTMLQADGSWTADITTGGSDSLATRVAALLVSTNYSQPCVQGAAFLPTNIFAQAITSAVLTRESPGTRWLHFSGYDWWVKSSSGRVGPGPNYFSDSTNNVWLDGQGQLHLRITNRSNQWQCAELVSARTFGFGNYRFELSSRVDNLNPNVVLGLFTWSDDPVYAHREIDIECSRWANAADTNNAQFVVQPFDTAGHLVRFAVPAGVSNATYAFVWDTNRVSFQSQRGSYSASPAPTNIISAWSYTLEVPRTGDENVRINLWLFQGAAPSDQQEIEVIIKSFSFVPLAPPQPAVLTNFNRWPSGQIQFDLQGEPDRRYELSASANLSNWQSLGIILMTNNVVEFDDTNSAGFERRFFRAETLP